MASRIAYLLIWFCILLFLLVYTHSALDRYVSTLFFDTTIHTFPLRHQWFFEQVLHAWLKNAVLLACFLLIAWLLIGRYIKHAWASGYDRLYWWAIAGMAMSTASISLLKHISIHTCPWGLRIFGGTQSYLPLFSSLPSHEVAGHCFPAGHPSSGFCLMAFYFAFRTVKPSLANISLIVSLLLGAIMSITQVARGAHFLSHTLWTGWLIWTILVVFSILYPPRVCPPSTRKVH